MPELATSPPATVVQRLMAAAEQPTPSDVMHIRTLRKAVGGIALALPFALVLGENVRDAVLSPAVDVAWIEASVSAYFHTGMRELFVGSLCAVAIFLLCYKGYARIDDLAANVAGLSLIAVAWFPTSERSREGSVNSATIFSDAIAADPPWVGGVHFASAILFFVILAGMSLFLFTRTADRATMTEQKRSRNRVYVACGVTMLASLAVIGISKLPNPNWGEAIQLVFWCETLALVAFGVSWLVKAEVVLADR